MRRVITVNLGGNAHALDEDAYERLRAYLALTESRLVGNPDRAEILGDLERSVADHLAEQRAATNETVVSDAAMANVIQTVGTVEQAEQGSASSSTRAPSADGGSASEYKRPPVFLLCLLLGWLGAHRYYVGKIGTGILQTLTIGGLGLWVLYDFIIILCGGFTDSDGRKILDWS
jgi:hypothetical protein